MKSDTFGRFFSLFTQIRKLLFNLGTGCLDLLLPVRCSGCQDIFLATGEGFWCSKCRKSLPIILSPICTRCGRPFLKSAHCSDHLCANCELEPPPFDSARSAALYSGVVRDRIHQLKFGAQLQWVPALSELIMGGFSPPGILPSIDIIIPVPLHLRRLQHRGFNQSALLAKQISLGTRIPTSFDALTRRVYTKPQTRLKREERLKNVKHAFDVLENAAVKDKRILLIDDVFTTGTTISECSRTLKDAGAKEVHAVTVARVLPGALNRNDREK